MTAFDPAVMLHAFQIGFPALFAMLNPLGTALVFRTMTSHGTREERVTLARQVALYSLIVMLGSLFSGSYLLSLFGISLEAVRIAGGLMVGMSAWKLLTAPPGADAPSPDTNVALRDLAVVPLPGMPTSLPRLPVVRKLRRAVRVMRAAPAALRRLLHPARSARACPSG